MDPDSILAGLRKERERATDDEHKAAIDAEIERVDKLPRPEVTPEEPETIVDRAAGYLAGLERELERTEKDRAAEIKAEIKRVKDAIAARGSTPADPAARAEDQGVEQAVNAPPSVGAQQAVSEPAKV